MDCEKKKIDTVFDEIENEVGPNAITKVWDSLPHKVQSTFGSIIEEAVDVIDPDLRVPADCPDTSKDTSLER